MTQKTRLKNLEDFGYGPNVMQNTKFRRDYEIRPVGTGTGGSARADPQPDK